MNWSRQFLDRFKEGKKMAWNIDSAPCCCSIYVKALSQSKGMTPWAVEMKWLLFLLICAQVFTDLSLLSRKSISHQAKVAGGRQCRVAGIILTELIDCKSRSERWLTSCLLGATQLLCSVLPFLDLLSRLVCHSLLQSLLHSIELCEIYVFMGTSRRTTFCMTRNTGDINDLKAIFIYWIIDSIFLQHAGCSRSFERCCYSLWPQFLSCLASWRLSVTNIHSQLLSQAGTRSQAILNRARQVRATTDNVNCPGLNSGLACLCLHDRQLSPE